MCDYCGCRESGPTSELADEHVRLQALSVRIAAGMTAKQDIGEVFEEFATLLELHAAKEEVGLFPKVKDLKVLDDQIVQLVAEHDLLHRQLGAGPGGHDVPAALKLLAQHIDDEEYDLFPHIIHALDPEDWEEIELAHRAVEAVFLGEEAGAARTGQHDHGHGEPHGHGEHPSG